MKCNLQCFQPLQSTAAVHMEELPALPESPGTWCATAATHPKWQGGKETRVERVQGMRPPVPRKELKYRFSPLNNHFRCIWMLSFDIHGRVLLSTWAFLPKPLKFLAESLRCHLLKILIHTSGLFPVLLFCAVPAQNQTSPSSALGSAEQRGGQSCGGTGVGAWSQPSTWHLAQCLCPPGAE